MRIQCPAAPCGSTLCRQTVSIPGTLHALLCSAVQGGQRQVAALFTFVSRDAVTLKAHPTNPLVPSTPEDQRIFYARQRVADERKALRAAGDQAGLLQGAARPCQLVLFGAAWGSVALQAALKSFPPELMRAWARLPIPPVQLEPKSLVTKQLCGVYRDQRAEYKLLTLAVARRDCRAARSGGAAATGGPDQDGPADSG